MPFPVVRSAGTDTQGSIAFQNNNCCKTMLDEQNKIDTGCNRAQQHG